jgi:protein-disulfide isomerase
MSKAARQRTARERLAEERKKQVQRDKQRRATLISVIAVAVLALVVGGGVYYANQKDKRAQVASSYSGQLAPLSRNTDGSIQMANAGVTAPTLEIFEDFQCPICQQFEKTSGSTIKRLAAQGKVNVIYKPFQLFQQEPLSGNSQRAANAALCVPADKWVSYHDALYKYQPAEGTKGFATKDLISWGTDLGITDPAFRTCVTDLQKKSELATITADALGPRKVQGTPTVFLNGKQLDTQTQLFSPQTLEAVILAAAKTPATPSPAGSATPSPSASATASPSASATP